MAQLLPNALGLYDLCGNVSEFVADGYGTFTGTDPYAGRATELAGAEVRGGSFPSLQRGADIRRRSARSSVLGEADLGLRIARTSPQPGVAP